ncbi:MAG: hypothetical protein CVU05_07760 [Bacteroidetes bacterium HGW-Bacteroidetes-21]|jgi:hypothetical protein|nr:MAG: hypothetical protein CVU05_07760 [Bacteroidetes bacterium HGW-Bacteroidetes-21]
MVSESHQYIPGDKKTPLEFIREIETQWPVETVTARGLQVWPHLRIYIGSADDYFSQISGKKSLLIRTFFSSVFYGFGSLFRKYNYIIYSDTKERRKIDGLYVDKSIDYLMTIVHKPLDIEIPLSKHFARKNIPTKHIVSKVFFYFIETVYAKLFLCRLKIKEKHVLDDICAHYNLDFNYKALVKRFIAQYVVTRFFIRFNRPMAAFIECYYTNIGRIAAFKKKGIKVVEIQHGVISNKHLAYNIFKTFDESYFPDYLFTFGESERKIAEHEHFYIRSDQIIPVGSFYIDYINSHPVKHSFVDEFREKYKYLVCVSGQNHYSESDLIIFLNSVARLNEEILFIFVPRDESFKERTYELSERILVNYEVNCYEMISVCDYHTTVFSTCALEAPSLGVPNILVNIKGLSKLHYEEVLNDSNTTLYVNSPEEYIEAIKTFKVKDKAVIRALNREVILPDYKVNIKNALKKISLR